MSFLQIFLICFSILFLILAVDLRSRKKIQPLTCGIIILGATFVLISSFNIEFLNSVSAKFGVARGAELIVYCSIIFLGLMFFHLMSNAQRQELDLSRLISQMAINSAYDAIKDSLQIYKNTQNLDDFLVHMRVYNEEQTLSECIQAVIKFGFKKFIFINDGSRDHSLQILQQLQIDHPDCIFIICSHSINRGGGAANKTGFTFIQQHSDDLHIKYILTFDPDGQMDISDMNHVLKLIEKEKNTDLFVGSRFIPGGSSENIPAMRRIILAISKFVTRVLYGTKVSDPHIGYRVYPLSTMQKIHLTADGMHYANEINEQIKQLNLKMIEFPVHIRYTDYSLGKGQKNSNSIKLGLEMLRKKFF